MVKTKANAFKYKAKENTFIYHHVIKSHKCTAMLMFNLAEPDWISVPCDKKLLKHVVCYLQRDRDGYHVKNHFNMESVTGYSLCSPDDILLQNKCHTFLWFDGKNNPRSFYNGLKTMLVILKVIAQLKQIFETVSLGGAYPPVVIEKNANSTHVIKFQRILHKLHYRIETVHWSKARGFFVSQYNKIHISVGINLFQCTEGVYI